MGRALVALGGLCLGVLLQAACLQRARARSRVLLAQTTAYERRCRGAALRILVLGDSTGVGLGAGRPEDTVAGLLAADFPQAELVNISVSGARLADVADALATLNTTPRFDLAVLHVGGNDVIAGTSTRRLAEGSVGLLRQLARNARRTLWLGPADLGLAPVFLPPLRWWLARRTRRATRIFKRAAAATGVVFVDFCDRVHTAHLAQRRDRHFASDGLHPSSTAYRYCYAVARRSIAWPADR